MEFSEDCNALKKLRKASWRFQQTFQTPPPGENLSGFVATIISATPYPGAGLFTIGRAVIGPDHLMDLFADHSLTRICKPGTTVKTASREEAESLLIAAFSDPLDFLFVPEKKPFVFFADHDQFTTFYASTRSNLNRIVEELGSKGFHLIPDYQRQL